MPRFPTEQETYHRLRWDPRFDLRRCQVVITLRPAGTKRMALVELDTNVVPWHRIAEYWIDDELAWSRPQRIDRLDELAVRAGGSEPRALVTSASVPHRFVDGAWLPSRTGSTPGSALRVVTWNLLFDLHDPERLQSDDRWTDALVRLEALDADVLALVEVTARMWTRILAEPWVRARYAVSHAPDTALLSPYGQVVLSKHAIARAEIVKLARDRRALIAAIGELGIAVVHLTSNRTAGASALRATQLAELLGHVRATPQAAWIVAGDFNAQLGEHADVLAEAAAIDAWEVLHPGDPGLTFDLERNPLAAAASVSGRSARYDRILAIADGVRLQPVAARLAGLEIGPCGLPPSDHFAVCVDFAIETAEVAHAPASRRSALVVIPPLEHWGALQRIRCGHDRGFARWPPHVTLLFPFVDDTWLARALPVLEEVAAAIEPFELELDRVEAIDKSGRTIVAAPSPATTRPIEALRAALAERFASLIEARTFHPHLTIARTPGSEHELEVHARWLVDRIVVLRDRDGRMQPSHEIRLGRRETHAISEATRETLADRIAAHVAAAIDIPVRPFGSAVYAPEHAADVDLIVETTADPRAVLRALGLHDFAPDRYRGTILDARVDLIVVRDGDERRLAGPADAAKLVEHLRAHGRYADFLAAWPCVRRFVTARALAGNGLGWFGMFGWALLLAVPLCHDEVVCAAADPFPAWLRWLAALRPGARIGFDAIDTRDRELLWIAAPAPPSRNVARALTAGTAAHLFAELRRGSQRSLADDPPPGETIDVAGTGDAGSYEGSFRGLLAELDARPWALERTPAGWRHRLSVRDAAAATPIVEAWLARSGLRSQVMLRSDS